MVFYGEELLATRPTRLDHLLSAVCNCLFNMFAATHCNQRACNLRTCHAVVIGSNINSQQTRGNCFSLAFGLISLL